MGGFRWNWSVFPQIVCQGILIDIMVWQAKVWHKMQRTLSTPLGSLVVRVKTWAKVLGSLDTIFFCGLASSLIPLTDVGQDAESLGKVFGKAPSTKK